MLVLADLHADAAGLEAVLTKAAADGWDECLLLGDLVGYGPEPDVLLDMVDGLSIRAAVRGNHEDMLAQLRRGEAATARPDVTAPLELALTQLSADRLDWLERLPDTAVTDDWHAVHAAPRRQEYLISRVLARQNEAHMQRDLVFFGHTHVPMVFHKPQGGDWTARPMNRPENRLRMMPGDRLMINPGSTSRNRDHGGGRSYATFDSDSGDILIRRFAS